MVLQSIRQLPARPGALARWAFVEPHAIWTGLLVPAVALALASLAPIPGELRVRVVSFLLALAGVVLVAQGIVDTRRRFGRPSWRERAAAWLRRRPRVFITRQRKVIELSGSAHLRVGGSATLTVGPRPSTDLDERVARLEQDVRRIDERRIRQSQADPHRRVQGELRPTSGLRARRYAPRPRNARCRARPAARRGCRPTLARAAFGKDGQSPYYSRLTFAVVSLGRRATSEGMRDAAAQYAPQFIEAGRPDDLFEQLDKAAEAVLESMFGRARSLGRQVGARAGIEKEVRRARRTNAWPSGNSHPQCYWTILRDRPLLGPKVPSQTLCLRDCAPIDKLNDLHSQSMSGGDAAGVDAARRESVSARPSVAACQ